MNFVAWRMLTRDRSKYLGLIFAIAFSTFLLENQTSIFFGILKRTGHQILDVTDADVWVMDPLTQYFEETKALKDTDLTRVRGIQGVDYAAKLHKGTPVARTPEGRFAACVVLGLDEATLIGVPHRMLMGSWERLKEPQSIILDKAGYILLFPGQPIELGRTLELNDQKVTVVGISDALPAFVNFPIIHARYSDALKFQGRERKQLSFVLVRGVPGIEPVELARRIERETGLKARTTHEFVRDCINYYLKNTGIPVNFGITISIAVIVGLVVSGQTFYLFTVEKLKEFGALKAIGVTNLRLVGMILLQAIIVWFIGYSLGTGLAAAFFEVTLNGIPTRHLVLMLPNVIGVGVLMLLVVLFASLLSLRRVVVLEPAIVFRG